MLISKGQGLLLLIEKYKNDMDKLKELKSLYLSVPNEENIEKINQWLTTDPLFKDSTEYLVSEKQEDPTLPFFKTHQEKTMEEAFIETIKYHHTLIQKEKKNEKENKISIRKIPYISPSVNLDHLQPDTLKVLTEEQFNQVKKLGIGKHKKNIGEMKGIPFSVLITKDLDKNKPCYFAIYSGSLGGGGYGKVRLAQDLESGKWFAIKLQQESLVAQKEYKIISKIELNIDSLIRQKKLRNKFKERETEEKDQRIMVMELVPGISLHDFRSLKKNDKNKEKIFLEAAQSAIEALNELFKKGILHRDIKISNLMLNYMINKVNVIDFGLAFHGKKGNLEIEGPVIGTPAYMAPELLHPWLADESASVSYNEATEIYALGKSIGELLRLTKLENYPDKIIDANGNEIKEDPKSRECLSKLQQLTFLKVDEHGKDPIFTDEKIRREIISFLDKMTATDPKERPGYAKCSEFFSQLNLNMVQSFQEQPKQIAIVDYDVINTIAPFYLEAFFNYLKKCDEVRLCIDQSKMLSDFKLIEFKRQLDKNKIFVKEEVLERASTDTEASFLIDQLKQEKSNINNTYVYVSSYLINDLYEIEEKPDREIKSNHSNEVKITNLQSLISSKKEQLNFFIDNIGFMLRNLNMSEEEKHFEIISSAAAATLENLDFHAQEKQDPFTPEEKLKMLDTLEKSLSTEENIKNILDEMYSQIKELELLTAPADNTSLKEKITSLSDVKFIIANKLRDETYLFNNSKEMEILIDNILNIKSIKEELTEPSQKEKVSPKKEKLTVITEKKLEKSPSFLTKAASFFSDRRREHSVKTPSSPVSENTKTIKNSHR